MAQAAASSDVGVRERALLGEQAAGSLIRNVWGVYRRHFVPIAVIFIFPTFPLLILVVRVSSDFLLVFEVVVYVAWAALAIAISDICLGTRPSIRRSYAQVLRHRVWIKLFTAAVMTAVLTYLGLLLLIVGTFWVQVRLVFVPTVVALERRSGRAAIRRTWGLTSHQFWRLFGLLALTFTTFLAVAAPLIAVGVVVWLAGSPKVGTILVYLGFLVLVPAVGIAVVLLYYDERVRRESYDADALSEDLMR
jgi:hypothetical protein